MRQGLCRDLGYSVADRRENIRRIAEVARLFNGAGIVAIAALISPSGEDRRRAREIVGAERFVEVHVSTPLAVCEARDPKGLYRRARAGEILEYTGVSAPYEPPEKPDLTLDTSTHTVADCVAALTAAIQARGRLPASDSR